MAKQKKKRNKSYKGSNAKVAQPQITRIKAENRSPLNEWWQTKKRIVKPASIVALIIGALGIIIAEIIKIATL